MRCPKCEKSPELVQRSDQARPFQFLGVAAVFLAVGGGLQIFSVALYPWIAYGLGAFVLSQAGVKWMDCVHAYCPACHHTMNIWPWTKKL